jgi:hypothetical protein
MTTDPIDPADLEGAITAVYRGPFEEFIARRDALARELRASKRRDDAERVKSLRKPSRAAWALGQVVFEDPASVEQLAAAIVEAQDASPAGARTAQEGVRAAVRAVAEAGARAAIRGKNPIESSELVAAVRAVIGDAEAFAAFRAGRLVDVPEGGGLDLLAAMSLSGASPSVGREPVAKAPKRDAEKDEKGQLPKTDKRERPSREDAAAARAERRRVEEALTRARDRAKVAERAALSAQARLEAAEEQLERAQAQANVRREELERARQDADVAAAAVEEAERAVSRAKESAGE